MSLELTAKKFLSKSELEELRASLPLMSLRDRLIITLLLKFGMRGAELREIRAMDLDLESNCLQVVGKKNSRPRDFPLDDSLASELARYIQAQGLCERDRLFDLSPSGLKKIWYRVRPAKKGLHSLRHTFAMEMYRQTRDIKLVQVCLGHRSIQNTMVYADYFYSRDEMRKAFATVSE